MSHVITRSASSSEKYADIGVFFLLTYNMLYEIVKLILSAPISSHRKPDGFRFSINKAHNTSSLAAEMNGALFIGITFPG